GGPPVAEKKENNEYHQQESYENGIAHFGNCFYNRCRAVNNKAVAEIIGSFFFNLLHPTLEFLGNLNMVCARLRRQGHSNLRVGVISAKNGSFCFGQQPRFSDVL